MRSCVSNPSPAGSGPTPRGCSGSVTCTRERLSAWALEGGGAATTHLGDFAPSLGAGGGATIELVSGQGGRLGLDIGLRYLTGGEVDYLTRGELQRNETGVTFEPSRSPATMFGVQIGIAVDF